MKVLSKGSGLVPTLPKELLHIILEMDGRIKYRNGTYINIIHKYDERYDMIKSLISKKIEIVKMIHVDGSNFYFEFRFDSCRNRGLCYDVGFNAPDRFEICYVDFRDGWKQMRTYL
jgi:hypothetical protein